MKVQRNKWSLVAGLMLLVSFALSACGDATATVPPATTTVAATTAAATTAAPKTTTVAATTAAATTAAVAVDMKAQVDKFLAAIPDGYFTVGKVDALKDLMNTGNAVLIDVREPSEYTAGHIPGFANVPIRTVAKNLDKMPLDKPLIVSCASGTRALEVMATLQVIGYTNARAFTPSFSGWKAANETVATDAVEAKVYGAPKLDAQLVATADKFLANLPDGYFTIGKVDALKDLMNTGNAVLIDVRETSEFADGHIAGFVNIPLRTLGKNYDKMPLDKPVVLSCASGTRCTIAMAALQMAGYSNTRAFTPSFNGWKAANEPVVK